MRAKWWEFDEWEIILVAFAGGLGVTWAVVALAIWQVWPSAGTGPLPWALHLLVLLPFTLTILIDAVLTTVGLAVGNLLSLLIAVGMLMGLATGLATVTLMRRNGSM